MCIYQRRKLGVDTRTLIRDEACSALTEDNTIRYILMLQKACEIGGFDQVIFVSHKLVTHGMADAEIKIEAGKVTVR